MWVRRLLFFFIFFIYAYPLYSQEHTWIILSDQSVDNRIERQLNILAARDQALIRIVNPGTESTQAVPETGGLTIELSLEPSLENFLDILKRESAESAIRPTERLAAEGFVIDATYPRGATPSLLKISANSWRGIHNALERVPNLLSFAANDLPTQLIPRPQSIRIENKGLHVVIADYPSFPERGIVEGFYGTPWTHRDRTEMLRFEGAHGLNVYYYAPKDDPYHRKLWREPYPPEARQQLSELVDTANRNFVDFCFAISPGLTMTYSSPQDFAVLTNKLDSVAKMGVSCFALFLDDVPQDLQNTQDLAHFKTLAQAHADLTNRVLKHLQAQSAANRLTLTPTTYTNEWGSRSYIQELGASVDPEVSIVWTGPKVLSPSISVAQAEEWGGYLHRPPLIWDNFPVNDGTQWCRYLGPLVGRDPHLPGAVRGLFSNPMIEPHASLIPLQTIADYLWNSPAYDATQSEAHALASQYGPDSPRQLAPFLKVYGDYYWNDPNFTPLFHERRTPIDIRKMQSQIAEMNSALERLRYQRRLEPLLNELAPAVKRAAERLPEVNADPCFKHLADGSLIWDENHNVLKARHLSQSPNLNGDFSKWEAGAVYALNDRDGVTKGAKLWMGPHDLSARVALAWDSSYFYVGVDVTDPDLYQPLFGRGIQNANVFEILLETGFRKNFFAHEPTGDEYALYFSPGNFAGVRPSIFSDEDYLPPRPVAHDYMKEIFTAWKKTPRGYSGDIAIPVTFFEGGKLDAGYEIGFGFNVQRVLKPARPTDPEDLSKIVLQSKKDRVFRLGTGNPSSYPKLMLAADE